MTTQMNRSIPHMAANVSVSVWEYLRTSDQLMACNTSLRVCMNFCFSCSKCCSSHTNCSILQLSFLIVSYCVAQVGRNFGNMTLVLGKRFTFFTYLWGFVSKNSRNFVIVGEIIRLIPRYRVEQILSVAEYSIYPYSGQGYCPSSDILNDLSWCCFAFTKTMMWSEICLQLSSMFLFYYSLK